MKFPAHNLPDAEKARLLFFGTPTFAVPALEALYNSGYNVIGVVTKPDEPAGRNQALTPLAVKNAATKYGIPVFQPLSLKESQAAEELPAADLYIVAAYGKIIPLTLLERTVCGALNLHPSLLPRWRGPSPIQTAILAGDKETGMSIILLDELMDHGPIVSQRSLVLEEKITYPVLHDRLSLLGAELLIETIPGWINGTIKPASQDDAQTTYSKLLKRDDGRINWSRPAVEIERMVRAFNPWPATWTLWPGNEIMRLRIEQADTCEETPPYASPGYVWQNDDTSLLVKTGNGSLVIRTLTVQGKRSIDASSFVHGHSHVIGATFV